MTRLDSAFFGRETTVVAIELLGNTLVHNSPEGITSGRIVEVEAYRDATDLASHAAWRRTGGVEAMSGPAGIVYVYRSYGIHSMFNVVAKADGHAGAVLIRALEPRQGVEQMQERRSVGDRFRLANGPGNLCQAMGITLDDHGTDLTESNLIWIESGTDPGTIFSGQRIGITKSVEHPWRFFEAGSGFVSAHRRGLPVTVSDVQSWFSSP